MSEIFEELKQQILSCAKCSLSSGRKNAVPGEGPENSKIMFVGEAPGREEDIQGRPFVGAAGQFLTTLLKIAGLERSAVFIGNIIKCRPPGNRDPLPQEIDACKPYLIGQIALIKPEIICTLGRHSARTLIDENFSITRMHGQIIKKNGITYFPTFHPAAALYNNDLKYTMTHDFQKLKTLLLSPHSPKVA